jgi:hypothetical protein
LPADAALAGWNSPTATDHEGSGYRTDGRAKLPGQAKMAGWATPTASEKVRSAEFANGREPTPREALTGWATPMARTPGAGNGDYDRLIETAMGLRPSKNEPLGAITESSPASTERRAGSVLNAAMSRWLMGYPAKWDEASPNYQDWCAAQERIASGDYEGTGTQS